MSHQAQVPRAAAEYFGIGRNPEMADHPIIAAEFTPDTGWRITRGWKKRVTRSWCRKIKAQGVTCVMLSAQGRHADFCIEELTRA